MRDRRIVAVLIIWLLLASLAGASGVIGRLPAPMPQVVVIALTFMLVICGRRVHWLRDWIESVSTPHLVEFHGTRLLVGAAFVELGFRGSLPMGFSIPAGWGDVLIGATALLLAILSHYRRSVDKGWYRLWNILGLIDLFLVIVNAAQLSLTQPGSMSELVTFPLSLVPTVLVPMLLASHFWILRRVTQGR